MPLYISEICTVIKCIMSCIYLKFIVFSKQYMIGLLILIQFSEINYFWHFGYILGIDVTLSLFYYFHYYLTCLVSFFFLSRYFSMNFGMHTLCKASFFPHLHNDGEYFIVMLLIVENQFLKIFDSFISNSWNDGFLSIQWCSKKYCFHIQEIFSSVISGLH